ncbi:MAG TPA: bifunctional [glutamate--ammonia ligase]-adenylyl-L-tyrosine phosphorylase/[glutamate--ammonia-ligase] adenylyltransferase [Polyangiaceae bacterium]|nr:bifunctional [glutamate--ammonia ligase]-adenylyl-L-tyrosine phosphorylase/[glutamate--ammonia-ligase] adenylyltransferase [Polyangiaceae bacterium]
MPAVTLAQELQNLALFIAPERARMLLAEAGSGDGAALGVLLGSAFPALTPSAGFQHDALDTLAHEGFRARRRQRDLRDVMQRVMKSGNSAEDGISALRRRVWREKARVALRELLPLRLGGASIEVTARELSALAAAAFDAALSEAQALVAERFGPPLRADGNPSTLVMLGVGKLGGRELNAGSDVDVVFVYDTDEGASRVSLHEHFSRVVQRAVATIGTPSADGLIWRVDLRLRPEGASGPIVNSVAATERYYETWGRLWERAALLRAQPSAGDWELGRVLTREVLTPFVYRSTVDPTIAEALTELVQRSRNELSPAPERDLKLGPGGIREAEFFVQTLQLVWGGREPALRVPGTLPALARLRSQGFVSDREARGMAEAYLLLRRVEHRIQWASGVQTHLLPTDSEELARLSRSLGLNENANLLGELARARETVHETFQSLTNSSAPRATRRSVLTSELDGDHPELGRAAELHFRSADMGEHIAALAQRPDGLLGVLTRERRPELTTGVIDALGSSADPEQAARYLRAFFGRFLAPDAYVNALADDPRALQRLITVFGASAFVGDAVSSRPELADVILFGGGAVSDARAAVAAEIETAEQSLTVDTDAVEREQSFIGALRAAKRRVTLEVAVADLAGTIGMRDATRILAELAEEILSRAVRYVFGDMPGFAVLALGKLGGRDLGYGSDLDVIFSFLPSAAPNPDEATPYFVKGAQRVIRLLTEPHPVGPGYELDTRLRPSGSHGLLVTSLESFARYHGLAEGGAEQGHGPAVLSSGAAWERQTLLRARGIVGDPELLRRALDVAARAAYQGGAPPALEMHHFRTRMEKELGRERDGRHDLKTGRGGLLDIEFAVQWLQMKHGADLRIRTPDLGLGLQALHAAGYLDAAAFEVFSEGYRFLRQLEQRIVVHSGKSAAIIDERAEGLAHLARRMGFQDGQGARASEQLMARYKDATETVRASYERALGLS